MFYPFFMTYQMDVIAEAIDYLVAHYHEQPSLEFLARRAGYDAAHFQKLFKENVGISPKRLVQYMTMRHARDFLAEGNSTLDTAFEAGLSGNGRLHDLFVSCEAVTPGDVQRRGAGLAIRYGWHPTPLGEMQVAVTARGVCWVGFAVDESRVRAMDRMHEWWPAASFIEDADGTAEAVEQIMRIWSGRGDAAYKLTLDLYGTNFQIQVWRALLQIPTGDVTSYQSIAEKVGRPKASRAVGTAVGANPVSLLIPCHRVIQSSGIVENYGWGSPRKKALLGMEQVLTS